MAKYIYPAVFTPENGGGYSVNFPDLEGVYTCGDTLEGAVEMAEDVLPFALVDYEDRKKPIPRPSAVKDVKTEGNEFVSLIRGDTTQYRKLMSNIAVKKTLTIPQWLNEKALAAGINFSQVLKEALEERLGA